MASPGTPGGPQQRSQSWGDDWAPQAAATHQAPIRTPTAAWGEAPPLRHTRRAKGPAGVRAVSVPGQELRGNFPEQRTRQMRSRTAERENPGYPASAQVDSLLGTGRWTRGGTPEPPGTSLHSSQRLIWPWLHLPSTRNCPSLLAETVAAERAGTLDTGGMAEESTRHVGLFPAQQVEIMVPGPTWWTGSSRTQVGALGYSCFSAPPRLPWPHPKPPGQDWTATRGSS